MLDDRVTTTGRPNVSWYDRAIRSEAALEAEYGELGASGSPSPNEPSSIDPYTSSVDTCSTRPIPASRATRHTMDVPSQLVATKRAGSVSERSTWLSAAKWATASCPAMASARAEASHMSAWTKR